MINTIFGVDIDTQAVEVTKLSLLLKVLEGEKDLSLFARERALPDLGANIKCGNSLIGPDFYQNQQGLMFGDEEQKFKINAFDWQAEFKEIFARKNGGFDAVIGNPPYIRSQLLGDEQRQYYSVFFKSATATYDIYVLFVEKSLALLNIAGRVGFILPNKFFTTDYGLGLRTILTDKNLIEKIIDFEDAQVFSKAGTYTCLLFLYKGNCKEILYAQLGNIYRNKKALGLKEALDANAIAFLPVQFSSGGQRWTLSVGCNADILEKVRKSSVSLETFKPYNTPRKLGA